MKKNIAKGKMTEQEREDVKRRVKTVTSLGDFTNVDFVVEVRALFASVSRRSRALTLSPNVGGEREHRAQADHLPRPR